VGFLDPVGLAFDVAGNLYVADNKNNSIERITGFISAYVAGHITNSASGASIPHAAISLIAGFPLIKGTGATADGDGYYNIQAEARQYTLTVSALGFCPANRTVTLSPNETKPVNVSLQPCHSLFLPLVMAP
jgi:hypothetical protein